MGQGIKLPEGAPKSPLQKMESQLKKKRMFLGFAMFGLILAIIIPVGVIVNNQLLADQDARNQAEYEKQVAEERILWEKDKPFWAKVIKDCHSKYAYLDDFTRNVEFRTIPGHEGTSWLTEQTKCIYFKLLGTIVVTRDEYYDDGRASSISWDHDWTQVKAETKGADSFPFAKKYFSAMTKCRGWIPEKKFGWTEDTWIDAWKHENTYDFDKMYDVQNLIIRGRPKQPDFLRCIGDEVLGEKLLNEVFNKGPGDGSIRADFGEYTFTVDWTVEYWTDGYGVTRKDENLIIDRTLVDGVQRFD